MPKGKRRKICLRTGKKPTHARRRKHWKASRRSSRGMGDIVDFTLDMAKVSVAAGVGLGMMNVASQIGKK